MTNQSKRKIDILSTGELLIDFISTDFAETLEEAVNFKRMQGGSPANLCMNMARLGNQAMLVSTLGNDDMGQYLHQMVQDIGVDCHHIRRVAFPTTLILVTRSKTVSNFEAYRGADTQIIETQFPDHLFEDIRLFHTTCFALSAQPAQSAILNAASKAVGAGCQLSIDANYAQKIWPDQEAAQAIVANFCKMRAIVKMSEVDWERLYNQPIKDPQKAAEAILKKGASIACITLGSEGCFVASNEEQHFLSARSVEVKDTTGAGDAFWSGFLTAWLDGSKLLNCAKAGRRMAEIKLGHFGSLPTKVHRADIYEDFE